MHHLKKRWFLISLALVVPGGYTVSDPMKSLAELGAIRNVLVACVLFVMSLPLEFQKIVNSVNCSACFPPSLAGVRSPKNVGSTRSTRWVVDGVAGIHQGRTGTVDPPSEKGPETLDFVGMLLAVVVIHLAMVAAGHGLGRMTGFSRADRIAVGFAGSKKTLVAGLLVAVTDFGGLTILPMVTVQAANCFLTPGSLTGYGKTSIRTP